MSQVIPSKYSAVVVDTASGKVLYQANANSRRYPASLTKMMTLYVLFEDLERGRFKLSTPLKVSSYAALQAPTKLGLRAGDKISVEDAIKGLITRSANDAAATIGENVAGSIPAFAERMTRTARAIGMTNTRFRNANGLPDPGQYTSAHDMMVLGVALQVRFPQYFPYFSTQSFVFRGKVIGNHNHLLGRVDGVDGIKTGYVNASGFNIVTSVKRDGRKLVVVVMGGKTAAQRDAHVVELINTYLPKATRARGYDSDLIAAVKAAPKVAGAVAAPQEEEEEVTQVRMPSHPNPVPRPAVAASMEMASADPAMLPPAAIPDAAPVTRDLAPAPAEVAAAPAPQPAPVLPQAPKSLAEATLPASLANSRLPSSAAEAFADVPPPPAPAPDAMAALVNQSQQRQATYQVASVESDLAEVAPPPAKANRQAKAQSDRDVVTGSVSSTSEGSGWIIQIGAVGSKKAARDLLDKARSSAGSQLAKADPIMEPFSKGGQTYVRARFGGFGSEKAATKACAALKKSDFSCFTIRL
ncbi:D-alanyl-D-alanine carboxypeptidase [Oryzibacter oryziterrae]|uniref:D-alanyl-D-alanine carboxypeptidase n=1 Tax=Oryzibacter oryziterrae TaxID=2766474 RepID=UPI001F311373|nr:D-alanyl-D-alanine carboxypeptidase [Oryzibacter oryziterrae]